MIERCEHMSEGSRGEKGLVNFSFNMHDGVMAGWLCDQCDGTHIAVSSLLT